MTGSLQLPAGTTALPSLNFTGSTTTGLSVNTNNLSFSTNASERMKISSGGVVSINNFNTTGVVHNDSFGNLSSSLIVDSDISVAANISDSKLATITTPGKVNNSATTATTTNTPNAIVVRDVLGNFSAGTMTANLIGNVTGSSSLNVLKTGDTMTGALILPAGTSANPSLKFSGSTNTGFSANTPNTLSFDTNGSEKMTIDGSGNVVISGLNSVGVVHTDINGLLSTSAIVDADIANATITNSKLATISSSNTSGAIVVRDGSGNFITNQITIVGAVTNPTDAATKQYVDNAISTGLVAKTPALVVSTTNVTLSGLQTIDGVSLVANDRVLLVGQTNPVDNGLWLVQAGSWIRPADFANGSTVGQAYVLITSGNLNTGSSWLANTPTAVVGTNPIMFAEFSLPDQTTGANVGSGTGQVFRNKTGITLNFRTLLAGQHTVITNNADDISFTTDATSINTPNTIVSRDGSGNFSAGIITADLIGTASNNVQKSGDSMTGILNMLSQNEIRFQDASGGEYVGLHAPTSVTSSYTLAFPSDAPLTNQTLRSGGVTATDLRWTTEGGSIAPLVSRVIYVTQYGNDISGDGSFDLPFATLGRAINLANTIANASTPVTIFVSAGTYVEDNSVGPLTITTEGISIVGDSPSAVIFIANTPTNDFLLVNQTVYIGSATFLSFAPMAVGINLTLGTFSVLNNIKVIGFLTGVLFAGGMTSSYLCQTCIFINNVTGIINNNTVVECTSGTFIGGASIVSPPANTGISVSGTNGVCAITGGSVVLCETGYDIGNNSLLTASAVEFKLNTFDIIQTAASHMTLSACTFAITSSSTDVDIQISGAGTYAEIIGCQFNGKDIVSMPGSTALHISDGAILDLNGGGMKNYDVALHIGTPTDTSSTILSVSAFNIHDCNTDVLQEGTTTLNLNASTASSSKIIIDDPTNVNLAYFDLNFNNALKIGNTSDVNTVLLQAAISASNNPSINYKSSFYASQAIGFENPSLNPSTLYMLSNNHASLAAITTDRTQISGVRLMSDEGSPIGGTSALRGWDINKNATAAELSFNYQNSDIIGQGAISPYILMQLDGVNNQLQLPASNTQLIFGGDTNLYRSAVNVLKTDDNFIINTLTPNRAVMTDPITNQLISSTTSNTELGYLTGVTSAIQTQFNNKVNKSGDIMTGTLQLPAGTTSLPSLIFTGSTATGLSANTNNLSFTTNGTESVKISSGGIVSINGFTTVGVVHNDASGNLSTSLIVNADIAAAAGIIDTKLATITTSGKVTNSATTAVSTNTPNAIVSRDVSGNFSAGTITANLNGNATTSTTSTTTINFTGSLSGDVTGTQSATVVATVGGQTASNVAAGTALANGSTNLNTASTIVRRDASGNFSAGTITANLNGSATNFSGSLSGDVTGTQSATVVSTVGGQTAANVAAGTILANASTNLNTPNTIVRRDASGNFSAGTITANLTGNATTSTSSINFTGSLSGDVTGTQSATVVSLVGGQSAANVAAGTILANASTNLNTPSTIVRRDASGNFSAGTITANLNGNATTSTTAISTTNFTGSLSGDVTGTQSATVVSLVGGQSAANVAAGTVLANASTNLNTANTIVRRDASGNFSAGTITANLIGNASTSTTSTNFTGSLSGDVTGTQSATVVSLVGGQTAANVAAGTVLANASTSLNTASTIVRRDASGNFSAGTITANLNGSASNFSGSLSGDVTGTQSATVVSLVGGQTGTNVAAATVLANAATNLNTASTIVRRDASGNFSAGIITANLNGNATTSTTSTNFTGSLSGDVTGTQSATVVSLVGGQTASNVAAGTALANAATNLNTPNTIVRRDASGNFSAGTITANLNGNATNFTGSLSGDVTGTQSATVVSAVGGQTAANVAAGVVLANGSTNLNTASTIVRRDASGNFSAGTITANLIGNVTGSSSLNVLKSGDTMTGPLILPAGTAAAPSLQFTGSTNTGLSAPVANTISFDANGVEQMTISTTAVTTNPRLVRANVTCDQAIVAVAAATGGTATALINTSIILLTGASAATTFTIVFPPTPTNGQYFTIVLARTVTVTGITNNGNGSTVVNGVTSLSNAAIAATSGGTSIVYIYYATTTSWYAMRG